jgi:CubicO group peptidase (beta-lactamase class C family)
MNTISRALAAAALGVGTSAAQPAASIDWVGLWEANRSFGPEVRGEIVFAERGGKWKAELAGYRADVTTSGGAYTFELPGGRGAFRGKVVGEELRGFWIQPRTPVSGLPYASPVTLRKFLGHWRGEVRPLEANFTWYLPVTRAADGGLAAYMRNPQRNAGVFARVERLEPDGERVRLVGRRGGREERVVLFEGRVVDGRLVVPFPARGGLYEFAKTDDPLSAFYSRGREPARYRYAAPIARDDGWPVATLEEVGISRPAIEALVQRLADAPQKSLSDGQVHSVLIARHGKLVLEEYFHGHHRDMTHDLRSAAKSIASVLVGAAMQAGIEVSEATPVYETMLGRPPQEIDPRKRAMTLGHLLTMTGGHHCDDNDENAPGNEDVMQEQSREPDWYRYILALPMDRTPGEKLVYCSADAHLAGGVLAKAAGEPLPELFDRLMARPMKMGTYHMLLSPTGEGYMGGGSQLLPRDFLKIAQLMASGGQWQGRRIFSAQWARKSGEGLREVMKDQRYGYLWNSYEYPYKGRRVHAVFAAGNGGQISMAIPELGLAIAFTGGSYNLRAALIPQRELIPGMILPAVEERR